MNDLSNEELQQMYLDCDKDIFKYGRLVMAWTERRNMAPGIIPNTHSDQYNLDGFNNVRPIR